MIGYIDFLPPNAVHGIGCVDFLPSSTVLEIGCKSFLPPNAVHGIGYVDFGHFSCDVLSWLQCYVLIYSGCGLCTVNH